MSKIKESLNDSLLQALKSAVNDKQSALKKVVPVDELPDLESADKYYRFEGRRPLEFRKLFVDGEGSYLSNLDCLVGLKETEGVNNYVSREVFSYSFREESYVDYLSLQKKALLEEEWRYSPALSDTYQVSNYGRVRSRHKKSKERIKKVCRVWDGKTFVEKELKDYPWRILIPSCSSGTFYYSVRLSKDRSAGILMSAEDKARLNASGRIGSLIGGCNGRSQRADFLTLITFWKNEPFEHLLRSAEIEKDRTCRLSAGELRSSITEDLGPRSEVRNYRIVHTYGNRWDCRVVSCRFVWCDYYQELGDELYKRGLFKTDGGRSLSALHICRQIEEDLETNIDWIANTRNRKALADKYNVSVFVIDRIRRQMMEDNTVMSVAADELQLLKLSDGIESEGEGDGHLIDHLFKDENVTIFADRAEFSSYFMTAANRMNEEDGISVTAAKCVILSRLGYKQSDIGRLIGKSQSAVSGYLTDIGNLIGIESEDDTAECVDGGDGGDGGFDFNSVVFESGYE